MEVASTALLKYTVANTPSTNPMNMMSSIFFLKKLLNFFSMIIGLVKKLKETLIDPKNSILLKFYFIDEVFLLYLKTLKLFGNTVAYKNNIHLNLIDALKGIYT